MKVRSNLNIEGANFKTMISLGEKHVVNTIYKNVIDILMGKLQSKPFKDILHASTFTVKS